MDPQAITAVLQNLRDAHFRDIAGARVAAFVPVSEALVNAFVAATMPKNLPVREVMVRPEEGNRFSVRISPRAAFIPPITLKVEIERQPQFPTAPQLVLRLATMGGLLGLAGAAFNLATALPPGVRLEGDRVLVDLKEIAHREGVVDLLNLVKELTVSTQPGVVLVQVDAAVP